MRRIFIIDLVLIVVLIALYFIGPLRYPVKTYPLVSGIIIGAIATFIPSAWSGHIGNRITEEANKKSREAKQKLFTTKLSEAARTYIIVPPTNETQGKERQDEIASKVKELSIEIFGEECPPIDSARPEETEYQHIKCKWCHLDHKAFSGSRGKCTKCCLPLDLWIGSQGQTHKSE